MLCSPPMGLCWGPGAIQPVEGPAQHGTSLPSAGIRNGLGQKGQDMFHNRVSAALCPR